MEVHALV